MYDVCLLQELPNEMTGSRYSTEEEGTTDGESYIRTDDEDATDTDWEESMKRWINRWTHARHVDDADARETSSGLWIIVYWVTHHSYDWDEVVIVLQLCSVNRLFLYFSIYFNHQLCSLYRFFVPK